jgi:NAD(P)-dependent dehydrogenase (short-subunit alcohol dehydrogenase family)
MKLAGLRVVVLGGSFGLGLAVAKDDAPQNATGVIASKQKHRIEVALGQLPAPPAAKRLISPTRQQMAPPSPSLARSIISSRRPATLLRLGPAGVDLPAPSSTFAIGPRWRPASMPPRPFARAARSP